MTETTRRVEGTVLLEKTMAAEGPVVLHKGGAGSGKSIAVAKALIFAAIQETGYDYLVSAKTFPQLKKTAYQFVLDALNGMGLYSLSAHNKSDHTYRLNGNVFHFMSIDDPEKIKSMQFRRAWMEEATNFTIDDFKQLRLRMGRTGDGDYRLYLTFNPVDRNCWIAEMEGQPGVTLIHSTVNDNPFIPKAYRDELRALAQQDQNFYQVYYLGEWGSFTGLIYHEGMNYRVVNTVSHLTANALKVYGLDAGYHNPFLVECGCADGEFYARELISEHELRPDQIIDRMDALGVSKGDYIIGDAADRNTIETIHAAGYNIHPSKKGADSVAHGIASVKKKCWQIPRDSAELLKQMRGYCYKRDKNGKEIDEPVKWNDHGPDALRYADEGLERLTASSVGAAPSVGGRLRMAI